MYGVYSVGIVFLCLVSIYESIEVQYEKSFKNNEADSSDPYRNMLMHSLHGVQRYWLLSGENMASPLQLDGKVISET